MRTFLLSLVAACAACTGPDREATFADADTGSAVTILLLTIVVLATACAPAPATPEEQNAFAAWLSEPFANTALTTGAAIEALGSLREKTSAPYVSGHAEGNWDETAYVFDGLRIEAIVRDTPPHQALVSRISITSAAWPLRNGLAVGDRVRAIDFPVPATENNPSEYCGINNCIEFQHRDGRITRIDISLYVD